MTARIDRPLSPHMQTYRWTLTMAMSIVHRATGIGVLLFLVLHVVETAAIIYSPAFYDEALSLYRSPFFRFAELLIFFSVLFHGANGLRIIVQDFWPMIMTRQRHLSWIVATIVVLAVRPLLSRAVRVTSNAVWPSQP